MLGAIGAGGAVLLILAALFAHKKGGGKLKVVKDHHMVAWGAALGLFAAGAGESFRQVGTVGDTLTKAITSQSATFGTIGPAAVALLLVVVGFAFKPHMAKDLIVGVSLPGAMAAAGGLLAVPAVVFGSVLHGLVGA